MSVVKNGVRYMCPEGIEAQGPAQVRRESIQGTRKIASVRRVLEIQIELSSEAEGDRSNQVG